MIEHLLARLLDNALRFGRLLIIGEAPSRKGHKQMLCKCDCGAEKVVAFSSLKAGLTRSCGCLRRETKATQKHGLSDTRTYKIWCQMRRRCLSPTNPRYADYGGRGITVAPEWNDFAVFLADMGEAPEGMSIERIDNERGYCKENCKWADQATQNRNTRRSRRVTHNGVTKTVSEWAAEYGLSRETLAQRLRNGWNVERALTHPAHLYHGRPATS